MDTLRALVLLLHAKHARAADRARIAELERLLEGRGMKALKDKAEFAKREMDALVSDAGREIDGLIDHIKAERQRVPSVTAGARKTITESVNAMHDQVAEIAAIVDAVPGSNNGPTLGDSETPPEGSPKLSGGDGENPIPAPPGQ